MPSDPDIRDTFANFNFPIVHEHLEVRAPSVGDDICYPSETIFKSVHRFQFRTDSYCVRVVHAHTLSARLYKVNSKIQNYFGAESLDPPAKQGVAP